MANRKNWLGILVIVLAFGMTFVGCGDGAGGTDPALNGTWSCTERYNDEVVFTTELTLNNGNLEQKMNGTPYMKGTYTTSGNKITLTVTHIYNRDESKWYSKAEIKKTGMLSDKEINEMFAPQTATYSISGNKLTIIDINEEGHTATTIFTKK